MLNSPASPARQLWGEGLVAGPSGPIPDGPLQPVVTSIGHQVSTAAPT